MKKIGLLCMVLILACAVFSTSLAEWTDGSSLPRNEAGNRPPRRNDAEEILLNQAKTILIPVAEAVWLRFVPTETAGYCFFSSCNDEEMDPVAYLYDEHMELIAANDDRDDEGVNFSLSCMLEAGKTYYFSCECTAEEDGECPVMITRATGLISAEAVDLPEDYGHYLTLNVRVFATAGTALHYQWYQELPDETDGAEVIDDSDYRLLEGEDREFLIVVSPEEGSGYCCKVSDDNGTEKIVYFSLDGDAEDDESEDEDFPDEDEDSEDEDSGDDDWTEDEEEDS